MKDQVLRHIGFKELQNSKGWLVSFEDGWFSMRDPDEVAEVIETKTHSI